MQLQKIETRSFEECIDVEPDYLSVAKSFTLLASQSLRP
ncbi:hypothetical protein EV13_0709 [Prochlorococcus sp. MIT 0702]|nr:hypothetical protein EV12_0332 [Prochlorococcus sp. MIT 0701]KGG29905.1 hypothetical protein EV13_0709 [Prochlorococcus sp. MIT 0702]